jgi:hypothetical protein
VYSDFAADQTPFFLWAYWTTLLLSLIQMATLLPLGSTATEALLVGRLKRVKVVSEAGFVQLGAVAATPADVRENKANSEKIVAVLLLNIVIMNASYEKCVCR